MNIRIYITFVKVNTLKLVGLNCIWETAITMFHQGKLYYFTYFLFYQNLVVNQFYKSKTPSISLLKDEMLKSQ